MAAKTSVVAAQRAAISQESKLSKAWIKARANDASIVPNGPRSLTTDSFQNFLLGMGMGTDNGNSANSYGFNPITRNRILCEWIYRGSWIGGVGVDAIANDMTRAGIEHPSTMEPEEIGQLDRAAARLDIWGKMNECIKWGRLYGGAICVALIDGQDPATPLRIETVGKDQFKGLITLDRWMIEPSLQDLVTDLGPHLGLPKFYKVTSAAPSLRGKTIHHSRVMVRHVGVRLPHNQALTENLWGLSVYERMYDRMTAFDMASSGAAQLVAKCWLRTIKIKGLREVIAAGGQMMQGVLQQVMFMRRTQSIEGVTLIDGDDELQIDQHQAFSGLDAILMQFAGQIAGGWQIPLVRLMGQSPGGLNATGEGDERIYHDNIAQAQTNELFHGTQTTYQLLAASQGIALPDDFEIAFAPLTQLPDKIKSDIAFQDEASVQAAFEAGIISQKVALQELQRLSRRSGRFSSIDRKMIDQADDEPAPPPATPEELMKMQADLDQRNTKETAANDPKQQALPGSDGKKAGVADSAGRRAGLSA